MATIWKIFFFFFFRFFSWHEGQLTWILVRSIGVTLPCDILFLCFSVLLELLLPRFGKRELALVLLVRLFDLRLFGFVCFLFLVSGCGLWLWHSLDFFSHLFVDENSLHCYDGKFKISVIAAILKTYFSLLLLKQSCKESQIKGIPYQYYK